MESQRGNNEEDFEWSKGKQESELSSIVTHVDFRGQNQRNRKTKTRLLDLAFEVINLNKTAGSRRLQTRTTV